MLEDKSLESHGKLCRLHDAVPPNTTFLPNLRILEVYELGRYFNAPGVYEQKLANVARMLLSPRLIDVYIGPEVAAAECILHRLPDVCPELRHLQSFDWPPLAYGLIGNLPRLQSFHFEDDILPPITRMQLENSTTLTSLGLLPICLEPGPWTFDPTVAFSALTSLTIEDISGDTVVEHVASFLRLLSIKPIQTLDLKFDLTLSYRVLDVSSLNEIISVVGTFRSLSNLALRSWSIGDPRELSDNQQEVNLSPLLRLHGLKSARLQVAGLERSLNDESIAKLTKAWPRLQRFCFSQGRRSRMKPVGLGCLALFALHCPLLTSLDLELDATLAPEQVPPAARTEERISLNLDGSLISRTSWAEVAAYISRVYPRAQVKMDDRRHKLHKDQVELWGRVIELVPVISQARVEERMRVLKQT